MMLRGTLLLAALHCASSLGTSDLTRATMSKPRTTSGLLAKTKPEVFTSINDYMVKGGHRVANCEQFTHEQLTDVTSKILMYRDSSLASIYEKKSDKRNHIDLAHVREEKGSAAYNMTRDGLCAQALMAWAHHIPTEARGNLKATGVVLPLMPASGPIDTHDGTYNSRISCTDCHYNGDLDADHVTATNDTGAPRWGGNNQTKAFSVLVNFTDRGPHWQMKYYYDDDQKASRWENLEGQKDSTCRGIVKDGKPCTVIYSSDGHMYIQSETICCHKKKQAGAVKSDWLQNGGGSYVGRSTVNGYQVDEWFKQGNYDNHYYALANDFRTPVRFMEHINGEVKKWDFVVPTWKPGPQPASLFTAPPNCDKPCP